MGEDLTCHLDDDGMSEVQAIEAADSTGHRQSLHVRVGPVFHGNEPQDEPGVWIELQEEHNKSLPQGPILLTPEIWNRLIMAVNDRLDYPMIVAKPNEPCCDAGHGCPLCGG